MRFIHDSKPISYTNRNKMYNIDTNLEFFEFLKQCEQLEFNKIIEIRYDWERCILTINEFSIVFNNYTVEKKLK